MIGVDHALEQYRRGMQQVFSTQGQLLPNAHDQLEIDRQLRWERSIMPTAAEWVSDRQQITPGDTSSIIDSDALDALASNRLRAAGAPQASRPAALDAPRSSEPASTIRAGALPLISVLSASTAVTGWLWTRRNRKRRLGLVGAGNKRI